MGAMSPKAPPKSAERPKAEAGATRVADALFKRAPAVSEAHPSLDLDARFSVSAEEVLRRKDFAQMSADEMAAATAAIRAMRMPDDVLRLRRLDSRCPRYARIDPRRSFRRSLRAGGAGIDLARREPERAPSADRRHLRHLGVGSRLHPGVPAFPARAIGASARVGLSLWDAAHRRVPRHPSPRCRTKRWRRSREAVPDWSGAAPASPLRCIFSTSTGCVASGPDALDRAALHRRARARMPKAISKPRCVDCAAPARRLIWLNPLLRFDGFEARATGIRDHAALR